MDLKKASIQGKMVDVISYETLQNNRDLYSSGPVAIEAEHNGNKYILPYNPDAAHQSLDTPGVYKISQNADIDVFVYPDNKYQEQEYQPEVIDFGNSKNIQEYIEKRDRIKDIEKDILTSPDNIFRPPLNDHDSPEMRGLKEAIIAKHIDIDKYADRFGENFPNDKRKMKDDKITLFLLKRMCETLDMKAELIISDVSPEVPNPIGYQIHINITDDEDSSKSTEDDN